MRVTDSAVSCTVADVAASARFFVEYLGYREQQSADGFVSLIREDALTVVFLRAGLDVLPEHLREQHASGLILALVVDELEAELARLTEAGVPITMPLRADPWGERSFQVTDPNGVVVQFLDFANRAE